MTPLFMRRNDEDGSDGRVRLVDRTGYVVLYANSERIARQWLRDNADDHFEARDEHSDCPECGDTGPHESNGETNIAHLAYACRKCGMAYEAM